MKYRHILLVEGCACMRLGTPDMGDNLVVKVHCAYMAT
jgi:hypothetical protein